MAPSNRRADNHLLYLPLLVLGTIYSVVTGEWWAAASIAGAAVGVTFLIPIDRYYGEATTPVERLVLALEHLLALGLLAALLLRAPRVLALSAGTVILWIAIFVGLVAYFARAAVAWRRFRQEGAPG